MTDVDGSDQASFTTSTLAPGTHAITAIYSGNTTFASSGSNSVSATINAPPMIVGEHLVMMQAKKKKGMPAGKAVLAGFELDYSTAMNPATAGLPGNYEVTFTTTKRVKKKQVTVQQPVPFLPTYHASSNSITLTIVGKHKFTKGGQISVIATPPTGVSSTTGECLAANDTEFIILPKASGIGPSGPG